MPTYCTDLQPASGLLELVDLVVGCVKGSLNFLQFCGQLATGVFKLLGAGHTCNETIRVIYNAWIIN